MNTTVQGHQEIGGATKRGRPDPDVKLPGGVKAAAERSNALIEQARLAKTQNDAAGLNDPVRVAPAVPNSGAPVGAFATADFDPNNPRPPGEADLRLTAQPTPPAPPQPVTPQTPEDWEHQFKSLKGRYDRDNEEKRRLQQQLIDRERLMAQMAAVAPAPAGGGGGEGSGVRFSIAPPPPGARVTPQEIQEYGPEVVDVMGRRAAEVFEPIINQLTGELNSIKRQIGGVQNTVAYDAQVQMYRDIDAAMPNWRSINDHPQFLQWLDARDPISGRRRRDFLESAHSNNQTRHVLDIFQTFLQSVGVANPSSQRETVTPGNGQVTHVGNPTPQSPQFDLMQYAAPGKAKEGQTSTPPEKPFITKAEIKKFYTDKTKGIYAGNPQEAARIEAMIFEAGNEHRIVDR